MKTEKSLRWLGISALAAVSLSNVVDASPTKENGISPIDRLQQIRADYLKSIGKSELANPDSVQNAQWLNFPNFGNFPNWLNGWRNY